jgi:glycosyltransferase involved in cell wall biosynthesis
MQEIDSTKSSIISVINPFYNQEKFIVQTIKSVQSQAYKNWKLLTMDDCSTDDSWEKIQEHRKKDKKRKVLHLITGIEFGGGAENMLLQLLPKMNDKFLDNRVCVIRGRGDVGKELEKKGIKVYHLDLKNIFDLGLVWRYKKVLKEFNPDVQVNYLIHADIFGRVFGRAFGVKKIVSYIRSLHTVKKSKIIYFLEKYTLSITDSVLTNSETTRNFYIKEFGINEGNIKCIPNAIDLDKFKNIKINKSEKIKNLGLPEGKTIIGTVSRLEKVKDIPTTIKAFSQVFEKNKNIYLLIVAGGGKEKGDILELIKKLGLENNVKILEKRKDVLEILQVMDIFVLASLSEGMSNALLEAMASRKIIITSDIDENLELIRNEVEGLNFKVGDPNDLAEKISFILSNAIKAEKYSENASNRIKNFYSLKTISNSFTKFLGIN